MSIIVTNRKQPKQSATHTVYCGRPGVLGNPFKISKAVSREQAIVRYAAWLDEQIQRDTPVARAFQELRAKAGQTAQRGTLALECWCAPEPCHCDVLKARLESHLDQMGYRRG